MKYKVIFWNNGEQKELFFRSLRDAYIFAECIDGIVLNAKAVAR